MLLPAVRLDAAGDARADPGGMRFRWGFPVVTASRLDQERMGAAVSSAEAALIDRRFEEWKTVSSTLNRVIDGDSDDLTSVVCEGDVTTPLATVWGVTRTVGLDNVTLPYGWRIDFHTTPVSKRALYTWSEQLGNPFTTDPAKDSQPPVPGRSEVLTAVGLEGASVSTQIAPPGISVAAEKPPAGADEAIAERLGAPAGIVQVRDGRPRPAQTETRTVSGATDVGGKAIQSSQLCTSAMTVRADRPGDPASPWKVLYMLTAGHCALDVPTETFSYPDGTTIGNASNQIRCNGHQPGASAECQIYGIDALLIRLARPSAHRVHSSLSATSFFQRNIVIAYEYPLGTPMCTEPASPFRHLGTPFHESYQSQCGVSLGWTNDGYFTVNLYDGHAVCLGDSGSPLRVIEGFNVGVAGLLSVQFDDGQKFPNDQCRLSVAGNQAKLGYSRWSNIHWWFSTYRSLNLTLDPTA